jgi:hypothetical protein
MIRLVTLLGALGVLFLAGALSSPGRGAVGTILYIVDATPATATNIVGTDHTVTATITDAGTPQQGFQVFFEVTSGPNAGANGSDVTDVNGEATFTYTGTGGTGQDSIDACIFSIPAPPRGAGGGSPIPIACDTVTKDWIDPTPTPSPSPSPSPGATLAAGTATPSPSPSAVVPVQLPGTGSGASGGSNAVWVVILVSVVVTGAWVGGVALIKRI